jgi:hypothetical protein
MIVLMVLLAWLSLFMASVLVTWLYWFGWTWIAWLIADKKAVREIHRRELLTPEKSS